MTSDVIVMPKKPKRRPKKAVSNAALDQQTLDQDAQAKGKAEGVRPKQADVLIQLASDAQLFHTPAGVAFADIRVNGHRETWPVRAKGFRRWLSRRFFAVTKGAPNSEALQSAINVIEAQAHFDAPEQRVFLRVGSSDGKIYLDLGDERWRAVEIDADGWQVIDEPPVHFRRTPGMLALPEPMSGGTMETLRPFLNVKSDNDFVLIVAWALACFRDHGPYPVIVLAGEQGSAKSTFAAILRSLLDPSAPPHRALPREDRDLFIAANNGHVLCFDNVSGLPTWISDTLCRLATGGGFAVRALYSDQDEVLFDASRPVILNGIEDIVNRPDLADRAIFLTLSPISEERRKSEKELWASFERQRPYILGALLDAVSMGLECLPDTTLPTLPRMADFALWAVACEKAIWSAGTFWKAYRANQNEAVVSVIEADHVAVAVRDFMADRTNWTGKASILLGALGDTAGEKITKGKSWPVSPQALSGRLRRAATFLRKVGIDIEFNHRAADDDRTRLIKISTLPDWVGKSSSTSSTSSRNGSQRLPVEGEVDELDKLDAKIPTQSGGPRCAQCAGSPDGREREFLIDGERVWLHEQCEHHYHNNDGWGLGPPGDDPADIFRDYPPTPEHLKRSQ